MSRITNKVILITGGSRRAWAGLVGKIAMA